MTDPHCIGHRQRVRNRFLTHGAEVLENYELLEMLLFFSVPVKDTKAFAKNLLLHFGSLDAVLSASKEELRAVSGVGERSAELISLVGRAPKICREAIGRADITLDDYSACGRFLTEKFKDARDVTVLLLSFDNKMRLVGCDKMYDIDYASGGIKPAPFIDVAVKRRASVAIIAHNHPYGPMIPSEGDIATNKLIAAALESAGVTLAEHYIITGEKYVGFMHNLNSAFDKDSAVKRFLESKPPVLHRSLGAEYDAMLAIRAETKDTYGTSDESAAEFLQQLLFFACRDKSTKAAADLLSALGAAGGIFGADFSELERACGNESCAYLIRLVSAICGRRITDLIKPKRKYSEGEIKEYLSGLFFGVPVEVVYLMSFDKDGRFVKTDRISEGTVNASEVLPRKVIDTAMRASAASVILAHNHPRGVSEPSESDKTTTMLIKSALGSAGVSLTAHYIAADNGVENFLTEVNNKKDG